MDCQEYIKQRKELHEYFLCFLDAECPGETLFNEINEIIQKNNYLENPDEFKFILKMISDISKKHHRSSAFFSNIKRILSHYSEYLKQNYKEYELFNIFIKNPQILHFLFVKNIISINDRILNLLLTLPNYEGQTYLEKMKHLEKKSILSNYKYYFYMDIQSKLGENEREKLRKELLSMDENIFDDFEKKCEAGENDSYICRIIREDKIKEFVVYENKECLPLDSEIKPSIFETNPLLVRKVASLIEYASFFGSIRIFKYLFMNGVNLTESVWPYAIHGMNSQIIHILENNLEKQSNKMYVEYLKESIKCHHNKIARYFEKNFVDEKSESDLKRNIVSLGFRCSNYEFVDLEVTIFDACSYDLFPVVKILVETKKVDINQTIIQTLIYELYLII